MTKNRESLFIFNWTIFNEKNREIFSYKEFLTKSIKNRESLIIFNLTIFVNKKNREILSPFNLTIFEKNS